jgi:hypothetical protein
MSSVPPGLSPLLLPLGEIMFYPTGRPRFVLQPVKLRLWGTRFWVFLSLTPTSGPFLRGSGIGLWSSVILFYLLSLPRRHCHRIRLWTRVAMALPPTTSPTRITSIRTSLRTVTGTPSSWRCTEGCDEQRSTVKNRVNQCSSDGTLRYVLLHERAPGSRARDKIKIGDPGQGATGG